MTEPDWQPTARLRWKEVDNSTEQPCARKFVWGEPYYFVLEQLWTREEYTEQEYGGSCFHSRAEEWRKIDVVE